MQAAGWVVGVGGDQAGGVLVGDAAEGVAGVGRDLAEGFGAGGQLACRVVCVRQGAVVEVRLGGQAAAPSYA